MNVLLIEDDALLADGITRAVRRGGFTVNHISNGLEAVNHINATPPDIIILDLGLPDIDGIDLLVKIRKKHVALPVLILTARDMLDDKIAGLDHGADDYLTKPFEPLELMARLRALERRINTAGSSEITIGTISLNTSTHETRIGNETVPLTKKEYMLLKALMENAGAILTKESLETRLYNWGEETSSNAIEVHIHHLRKKMPADFIRTVHGMGYIIKKS